MLRYSREKNRLRSIIILYWWLFMIVYNPVCSQYTYQSLAVISTPGNQYSPIDISAQFISSTFTNSFHLCLTACNTNTLCRVFDFEAIVAKQCRLFEGDIGTLGTIISSSMLDSLVGTIQITPSLFKQYGQPCSSVCAESRYLTCSSTLTCQCMPHTYWDSSAGLCLPQSPIRGASCKQGMNMCRTDLNYTCLQFNQCGPLSLLSGKTIMDRNTVIQGSSFVGLSMPYGLTVYDAAGNESLIIVDEDNSLVVHVKNAGSNNQNVSQLVYNWPPSDSLVNPYFAFLDTKNGNDLYVSDTMNNRVVLVSSMQTVNPLPKVVAGVRGFSGSTTNKLSMNTGVAVDKQKNLYVADIGNCRIMRWAPNATSGTLIAGSGTNTAGSNSMSLDTPYGIFLDEYNSLLYVADSNNNRIQLYKLNGTSPRNGTTIAGGNGPGSGNHQLNQPTDVWVSKKTGSVYIVDSNNNRIQRWSPRATSGVTVAGDPGGGAGTTSTTLSVPWGLAINTNETRMYVSDMGNGRVQRFDLI